MIYKNLKIYDNFFDNPPISLLDSSLNDCDFSLDPYFSLRNSSSLHNSDLEECFQNYIHIITSFIPPSIPSTIPHNSPTNPKFTSWFLIGLLCSDIYLTWFEVFPIFQWLVIHDLTHLWTDIKHVWICSKHLWFISQVHPSFIFLHLSVFPSCS